ncbi:MAG: DUF4440 domain-containing protein, partial [Gemmatimonadaceae bacterium]
GGHVETREEYRSGHLRSNIESAKAVPTIRSALAVTTRGDVAWARSSSETKGEFRGRAIDSLGTELIVLTRDGNAWRISAIHWSSHNRSSN